MKNSFKISIIFGALLVTTQLVNAQVYEVPPSSTTSSSVPIISDAEMEACVILYNNAKNLNNSEMINRFNRDCAGKQSASAARAAAKLNQK